MIVMGIDTGLANLGWCVVRLEDERIKGAGVIRTKPSGKLPKHRDDARRIEELCRPLRSICEVYKPDLMLIEAPAGSKSSRAALGLGYGYAVALSVADGQNIPCLTLPASAGKMTAGGSRSATKGAVADGVLNKWPELYGIAHEAVGRAKRAVEHVYDAAALVMAYQKETND